MTCPIHRPYRIASDIPESGTIGHPCHLGRTQCVAPTCTRHRVSPVSWQLTMHSVVNAGKDNTDTRDELHPDPSGRTSPQRHRNAMLAHRSHVHSVTSASLSAMLPTLLPFRFHPLQQFSTTRRIRPQVPVPEVITTHSAWYLPETVRRQDGTHSIPATAAQKHCQHRLIHIGKSICGHLSPS